MSKMRKRVSLLQTSFWRNRFVTARKRDRLERQKRDLLWIIQSEPDNGSHLIIVDAVYECRDQNNLNPRLVKIINRPELNIEEIAHLAMAIRVVPNTVELKIHITQTGFRRLTTKLFALRELDPIRGSLDRVIPNFPRVFDRFDEVRRNRWFAS